MASMGASVDIPRGHGPYCFRIHGQIYHRVGPLYPEQGQRPLYGQVHILDTRQAEVERRHSANALCWPSLVAELGDLITTSSPYARSFRMMEEVLKREEEEARIQGRPVGPVKMHDFARFSYGLLL
ncbi:hypothetical protein OESDEN_12407 [Oesophagostomum dentatum]|uniref:Uncharacterized protein n=1 Tax=Oesophagostomum dentatum TaxID=61180 RepID=A0A0B1SX94_OESDE|nr:hypothetical protein OESDEN_12407 [Oesophagostomum dentatum]